MAVHVVISHSWLYNRVIKICGVVIILGVYFSGTGNTKHCVAAFARLFGGGDAISIEDACAPEMIASHSEIVFGYPVYFSNMPKIVQDFLINHGERFRGKRVYIIATMGMFSGDGAGCAARRLKKCGAVISGALHLKMPDSIGDEKVLKKTEDRNRAIIRRADDKIALAVHNLKSGKPLRQGLGILPHIAGLLGQRLWFYGKTASYKQKPDINKQKCTGCGVCAAVCPMGNITVVGENAAAHSRCTLCYRCFSHCPAQALTILGKRVHEQYLFENFKDIGGN